MFNIFEQPWTLLTVSILVLFVILIFRRIFPEKQNWWQWFLPVLLAIGAFGLDYLVQTNFEKINTVINAAVKAVEEENCAALMTTISDNYEFLLYRCAAALRKSA